MSLRRKMTSPALAVVLRPSAEVTVNAPRVTMSTFVVGHEPSIGLARCVACEANAHRLAVTGVEHVAEKDLASFRLEPGADVSRGEERDAARKPAEGSASHDG